MSTQEQTTTTVPAGESCGIKGADEFAAKARALGLAVEVKTTKSDAVYYDSSGEVMLPAVLSVMVLVEIPTPDEFQGTACGLYERCTSLTMAWSKRDTPRARGRWTMGNYSILGGHEDLHVMHKADRKLASMKDDMERLRRLAQD